MLKVDRGFNRVSISIPFFRYTYICVGYLIFRDIYDFVRPDC